MWVLQIDDDHDDLEIFGEAVNFFDSTVKYCGFGTIEGALAFIDKSGAAVPDIIFLDINMPRHSGFDCYTIFKNDSRFIHTRFVFVSTTIYPKEIPPGCDFIIKQHSLKTYVTMLKNLLRQPSYVPYENADFSFEPRYRVQSVFAHMQVTL
jgi:CheY-like chemotaxis protein